MLLLCIPAFACDDALYAPVVPLLRPDFECETAVPRAASLEASARAILDEQTQERFLLWGTSLGGHVARTMALLAPERVAGLVISGASAAAPASRAGLEARGAAIRAGGREAMLEDMAREIVFEPEGRGQDAADAFRAMAANASTDLLEAQNDALMGREDGMGALANLAMPTLLLWGAADRFSSPETAQAMAAAIPGARAVILDECGHLPSLESPMQCAAAIRKTFVES